jgi:hypothetical protein
LKWKSKPDGSGSKIEEAGMRSGEKLNGQEKSNGERMKGMEAEGKRSVEPVYRNETGLDKGGLAAARVVLLWSWNNLWK